MVAFQNLDYILAEKMYRTFESVTAEKWEPILKRLGHMSRELGR